MIWGEAANLRYCPEFLCFTFKLAMDYLNYAKLCYHSVHARSMGSERGGAAGEAESSRATRVPSDSTRSSYDQYKTTNHSIKKIPNFYLIAVIRPVYEYLRNQLYESPQIPRDASSFVAPSSERLLRKRRDHAAVVGYDDVNEFFWSFAELMRISVAPHDGGRTASSLPTLLMACSKEQRWSLLGRVEWGKCFRKTFWERRSVLHLLVNFSAIWVTHITAFFILTVGNFAWISELPWTESVAWVSMGGVVAVMVLLASLFCELFFLPPHRLRWRQPRIRLVVLLGLLVLNGALGFLLVGYEGNGMFRMSRYVRALSSLVYLLTAVATIATCVRNPTFSLLQRPPFSVFTSNFAPLDAISHQRSISIWCLIFFTKFLASYFYLIRPFGNSLFILLHANPQHCALGEMDFYGLASVKCFQSWW